MRCRDDACIGLDRLVSSDAVVGAVGQHAQQTRLQFGGMSPISSRNSVPPAACSKRPRRIACAPVNAPRSCPNNSLSSRSRGIAAMLSAMNGIARACAVFVQRTRNDFLAAARFSGEQHRHIGLRQPSDGTKDLLHRRRLAQDFRGISGRLVDLRLAQAFIDRASNQLHRLVDVEWLWQIFERAALEG